MKNTKLLLLFLIVISSSQMSGQITINGTVRDCENMNLFGVNIFIKGKKQKNVTDFDGNFTITANKNDIVLFSCVGFETKQIIIENSDTLNIVLKIHQKEQGDIKVIAKKPVIYLYPIQKTDINISLNFKGELLTTFPKYDKKWTVTAYPDGRIFDKKTNRFYTSLFWDGAQNFPKEHYQYQSGFVVSKNNLTNFLIEKLDFIGLNNFETNDFVQYWLPILEKNETNFIHFYINSDYDVISKNIVSPKPDISIRIFMEFYGLDKPIEIPKQHLQKTERRGFTLVEWGGSDVSEPVNELKKLKL